MNLRSSVLVMALTVTLVLTACNATLFGQVERLPEETLIERAARKSEKASLPKTAPAAREKLMQSARELYRRAAKRLAAKKNRVYEEFRKQGRIDRDDQKAVATEKRLFRELTRARLLLPVVAYEISKTYEAASEESREALAEAAQGFDGMSPSGSFLSRSLASWYALLWEGRCYRDLEQFDEAFQAFTKIATLPDDPAAFLTLKHRAMIAHLETCMAPKLNKHAKAAKDARIWVDWTPKEQRATPGGRGIKYLAAEAMLTCIAAKDVPEAKRSKSFHLARRFLLDVSKHPGEYRTKAKDRLAGKDFAEFLKRYPPPKTENKQPEPNETEQESDGDRGLKAGTRPRMLAEINDAVTTSPEVEEILRRRNLSYGLFFDPKRAAKALADADAAVRDSPKSAEARLNRARIRSNMKDRQGAMEDVNTAIKLDSTYADAFVLRGLMNRRLEKHEEARRDFNRAVELDPTDHSALAFRGETHLLLGDLDAAIEDCYIVTRVNPGSWDTRLTLAEAYFKKGDFDNAMSAVNMTIHLTRRCYLAYRLRAKLHASQGRIQQAIDDCNASIDYYKVDEDTFILRGDLFVEQEKYEAAIEDYLAAARIEPKSTLPHLKCGLAHFLAGNIEEVGKCRDLAVRANPADAHPYRTLGKEMLSKGSRDEAIRCFSVSIALNPRDPEARAARGNAFKDMGNAKKAAADFQKAEELKKGQRGAQRNGN